MTAAVNIAFDNEVAPQPIPEEYLPIKDDSEWNRTREGRQEGSGVGPLHQKMDWSSLRWVTLYLSTRHF